MISAAGELLERRSELGRITALLERARAGEGGLVVVEGPAGIGKTRFVRAARLDALTSGFLTLAARGTELEHDFPFGVVRQLLEPPLRAASSEQRARLVDGAASLAVPVLLAEVPLEPGLIDPAFGALHGLYWLCANLAEAQPLLLVVDDVHWADEASLRYLEFLAHRLAEVPILLLVTQRSGTGASVGLSADPLADLVSLRPLSVDAVAAFLLSYVGGEVDEQFANAVHVATGGNPLLLAQVVQALLERAIACTAQNAHQVEAVGPEAVSEAVLARLARLDAVSTSLARAAAVLGDDAPLALAGELAGLDESAAADATSLLVGVGLLEDARPLRFVHPIVRAAVEKSVDAGNRAALHSRAADLLAERGGSVDEVVIHLLMTEPQGRPWVVDTLAETAQRAVARGAPEAAVPMLVRALAEPAAPDQSWRLLLDLGRAESILGRHEAIEHLLEAHRLAVGPSERGTCALQLSWARMSALTHTSEITPMLRRAITECEPTDPSLALELETALTATLFTDQASVAEAKERLERFANLEGNTRAECALLGHLAHYRMDSGEPATEALPPAERSVENEAVVGTVGFDAFWLMASVLVLRNADRLDTTHHALAVALEGARRRGAVTSYATALLLRSAVFLRAGEVREAEADARAALGLSTGSGWGWLPALATLIDVLIELGELSEAEHLLAEHGGAGPLPDVRPATVLVLARGSLRAEQHDFERALDDLETARRRLERFTTQSVVGLDGRIRSALVRHRLGDVETAAEEARAAVAIARAWGVDGSIGNALRAQGLVTGGDQGLEFLQQAVESLERSPRRLDHARALADRGAALRRRGDRAAAREPLRQALGIAHECGGIAVRERARQELAATGVRVRREAQTGSDSLTPSEQRIAELAAGGASNRDIAQALFVTVKTVEMHLGHTYRKLGISSRHELSTHLR